MNLFWRVVGGLFGGIILILIAAAIFSGEAITTNPSNTAGSSGPGGPAPAFTGQTFEGEQISLEELYNEKPVILDFWATWCPNCRRDMPILSDLQEKYIDDVTVLGVNLRESSGEVSSFHSERGLSFTSILDSGSIARQYGVTYTNTHVLIGTDGEIIDVITGDISERHFTQLLAGNQ